MKELFHKFKHYFTANIAVQVLSVLSLPVYTSLLSPADYGVISIFFSSVVLITPIVSLNAYMSIGRYYFEKDKNDFNEFLGNSLLIIFIFLLISAIITIFYREEIHFYTGLPNQLILYLYFVIVANIMFNVFEQIKIAEESSKIVMFTRILKAYLTFGISVICIIYIDYEAYESRIFGEFLSASIFFIYFAYKIYPYVIFSVKFKYLHYMLSFGLPLIPYSLSSSILTSFDLFFIKSTIGARETGLYSLAYSLGALVLIFQKSFFTSARVDFYNFLNNHQYNDVDLQVKQIFLLLAISTGLLLFFTDEIGIILSSSNYHSGLWVSPIIIIGYFFYSIYLVYGRYLNYEKKTIIISIIALISGTVNIVLNFIFIPLYGYEAAAFTTVFSYFLMSLIGWVWTKNTSNIKIVNIYFVLKPIFIVMIFLFLLIVIKKILYVFWLKVLVKIVLAFLISALVYFNTKKFI